VVVQHGYDQHLSPGHQLGRDGPAAGGEITGPLTISIKIWI